MTTRKPPTVSFPDWVEHQIREAERNGAFENLPGKGKPIPDLDRVPHELAWVANYLRRENVDVAGLLPPALALAKEVETLRVRLLAERAEARAREIVDDLNARIARGHAAPQVGPPLRVKLVDADAAVAQWRTDRADLEAAQPEPAVSDAPEAALRRRTWWRRNRA